MARETSARDERLNRFPMRGFGLTPDSVLARTPARTGLRAPSLAHSMIHGSLALGAVSVLAYSLWAFQLIRGTAALYASIAAVYLVLAGVALGRLVIGSRGTLRFALLFAMAFAAYAVIWCAFWFGLAGRHHADLWGAAVGLAVLTLLIRNAFGKRDDFLPLFAVVFACHTLGYTLGDVLYAAVRGTSGRMLWGAAHGLGFGAGLGYLLFHAQAPVKLRLSVT